MNVQKLIELFPEVKGKRFDDLVADIKAHGLTQPIVQYKGKTIDGRARERACKLASITPRYVEFDTTGYKGNIEEYLWSTNVVRRQLTADQRAVLVFEWQKALKAEAKERQVAALKQGDKPGTAAGERTTTRHALAEKAFVTTHKIQQVEVVKKHAPKLADEVAKGKMKLKDAAKIANTKRRDVTPIRETPKLTVQRAIKAIFGSLKADIANMAAQVDNPKAFYLALSAELSDFLAKKAA